MQKVPAQYKKHPVSAPYRTIALVTLASLLLLIILLPKLAIQTHVSARAGTATNSFPSAYENMRKEDDYHQAVLPENMEALRPLKPSPLEKISQAVPSPNPNIIFIVADDQPPQDLGIAGNSVIKTPNIDALGAQGAYFKNMYLPIGQCAPSRASILTGKLPHTTGLLRNGIQLATVPTNILTLPYILQHLQTYSPQSPTNYTTAIIGKCHLGDPDHPMQKNIGFDSRLIFYPDSGSEADWYNYQVDRNNNPTDTTDHLETHTQYVTDYLTDEAISYIGTQAAAQKGGTGKPFFLWLSYLTPHDPHTPPKGANNYTLSQMPTPVSQRDNLSTKPIEQQVSDPHVTYKQDLRTDPNSIKKIQKNVYECITNLDTNVGRIVQSLNTNQLRNNTMIVYLSDNGIFTGEHQMIEKGPTFYEEQVKSPVIFNYPGAIPAQKITKLATSIDLFPSILEMVGLASAPDVQGKSMWSLLTNLSDTSYARSSIYMEYTAQTTENWPMRGVVTSDGYKFTHYLQTTVNGVTYGPYDYELYNLKTDPYELTNILRKTSASDNAFARVLGNATYGKVLSNISKQLAVWQTDTSDTSRTVLSNIKITPSSSSIVITWNTVNSQNPPVPVPSNSFTEITSSACPSCTATQVNVNTFGTQHSVTFTQLSPATSYKIRLYSITQSSNGGYQDVTATTLGGTPTPTSSPTAEPTIVSTSTPTPVSTLTPTDTPTSEPVMTPTDVATAEPTITPTTTHTSEPTIMPTETASTEPTMTP